MTLSILISLFSICLALVAAAYLQLPTFLLVLGYGWFHRYKLKRRMIATFSLVAFAAFVLRDPPLWSIIATGIPVFSFLTFSLLNANPKVFIALDEDAVRKEKSHAYTAETEVLGYADPFGNAVAYPLAQLVRPHHLLNDVFAGNPLLVSYCMACRSAMLYHPQVGDQRLRFEVLGVYRRNMVMGDLETGTVWQQGTGEAMQGSLKGERLRFLPYQILSLKDWLTDYPESYIASESDTVKRGLFSKERLAKMMTVTERLVTPGRTDLTGLPLRETVFGVEVGGASKAYPVSELRKAGGVFRDGIANVEVSVDYDARTRRIQVTNTVTGERVAAQSHWWFGWKEFHPDTEVWRHEASASA